MANRAADIDNGSQVKFLLGTQEALEPYIKGTSKKAVNGTFYLTNDSHRLYVGNKDGKAVPVNEGVTTVANLTLLESYTTAQPGEFFYVTDSNILCVCASETEGSKRFVQINNNSDHFVNEAKTEISVSGSTAVFDQSYLRTDNVTVGNTFNIATAEGITVAASEDKKTLTITGTTNDNFAFTIKSDGTSSTATAVLTLTDSSENTIDATIKSSSSDLLNLTTDTDGALLLTPKNQKVKSVNVEATAAGFSVGVTNHDNIEVSDTIDPKIKIGVNESDQKTVSFVNGTASLDVYAKSEIDAKMLALNAMTYKGLVKSDGNTNTSAQLWSTIVNNGPDVNVSIGDTFLFLDKIKFTQTGSSTEEEYSAGTLAIAKSSTDGEDANGYLTGTIDWDYVESTNNTDTTYNLALNDKTVQLKEHTGNITNVAGSVEFASGDNITVAVTGADKSAKVVFNHNKLTSTKTSADAVSQKAAAVASNNTASTSTEVTVLDSISVDDYGHVSDIKTKKVTLLDTNSTINKFADSIAVASNVATISSGLQLMHGNNVTGTEKTASFKVTSNNLSLSAQDDTLTIDLVWGTF